MADPFRSNVSRVKLSGDGPIEWVPEDMKSFKEPGGASEAGIS